MTDPTLADADNILTKFSIDGMPSVFQLGCTATPQNVHAQQQRAFNLAWALHVRNQIQPGEEIAVIGGGIAGLTLTSALVALGAQVDLYESMGSLMHLQQGNLTRFIHPNIALWPKDGFGYPVTHLPFMNWRSGTAGEIEVHLRTQWKRMNAQGKLAGVLKVKTNCTVKRLRCNQNCITVIYKKQKNEQRKDHSLVVIASGYGYEKPEFSNTPSYWRNDDFAQMTLGVQNKVRYLVSGTGDGGLIDVLRLTLRDFQHQKFFQDTLYDSNGTALSHLARQIEKNIQMRGFESAWTSLIDGTEKFNPGIENAIDKLFSKNSIRPDTSVILNSRRDCPFLTEAQIFHRLLVALLLRRRLIEHVVGDLQDVYINKENNKIVAAIKKSQEEVATFISVDFLIQRHNAQPTLSSLLSHPRHHRYNRLIEKLRDDHSHEPKYPTGFLADEFKGSHYENSYEVGFAVDQAEARLLVERILTRLRMFPDAQPDLKTDSFPNTYEWTNGRRFELSWREHTFYCYPYKPINVQCLVMRTDSRELLELALYPDEKYQFFRIFPIALPFPYDDAPIDTHTGTWILIGPKRQYLEIQYWDRANPGGGLREAHRLLRLPTLLELVLNRWPVTKVHGIGWASFVLPGAQLRVAKRGHELLHWDNHLAWWLPREMQEHLRSD